MRAELDSMGKDVHFIIVNAVSGLEMQEKLLDQTAIPMLQDEDNVDVWGLMAGAKDDFYVFDSAGKLAHYLPVNGDVSVILNEDEGYNNLLDAIVSTQ